MSAATPETKVCCICREELPITEFYRDSSNRSGRKRYCRGCQRERKLEYEKRKVQDEQDAPPERTIPPEYIIPIRVLLVALSEAASRSKRPEKAKRRREALEWLLTYDIDVADAAGFSCGACLSAAQCAGIERPSIESFQLYVHKLARRAGFDVVYADPQEFLVPILTQERRVA